jgi:large subunit ribosomal protein L6
MQKYLIQIPNNIKILYHKQKNSITIIGPLDKKTLKLSVNLKLDKEHNILIVTKNTNLLLSNNMKKKLKALQGTTFILIKQMIIETSAILFKNIKFVGIGYKAFEPLNFKNLLLQLKLGYSHPIFFRISPDLKFFCLKLTKIFIMGTSYQKVTQEASKVRALKIPDCYKGKGILYENEKIILKEGKKI